MRTQFRRTEKAIGILNAIGDVLLLQLCFVVASLGVITLTPAAIALQRCLHDLVVAGEAPGVAAFARSFGRACRSYPGLALAVPLVAVMLVVGVLFWVSTTTPLGPPAVVALVMVGGLLLGLYLSSLAVVVCAPEAQSSRGLVEAAGRHLRKQPLAVAGCVIVMLTWLLLLMRVPTLGLVGTGVVPGFLALWLHRRMWTQGTQSEAAVDRR